jgi:hypothetical protein
MSSARQPHRYTMAASTPTSGPESAGASAIVIAWDSQGALVAAPRRSR